MKFTGAIQATIDDCPQINKDKIIVCTKCDGDGETQPNINCIRCEGTGIQNFRDLIMTRAEKILQFMSTEWGGRRWCEADACGCMGCVNGSLRSRWKQQSDEEMPISKDEFYTAKASLPPEPEQKPINLYFKSIPKKL